jgi:glycosyltransferase involved in cell wall biosynthesis
MTQDVSQKKILFVSARLPFPAIEGHQIRAYGLIKELSKISELYLLSVLRPGELIDLSNELADQCASIKGVSLKTGLIENVKAGLRSIQTSSPLVVCKYVTSELKDAFIKQLADIKPDIVHLDLLTLAELADLIPAGTQVVLNEHNVESDLIVQKIKTLTNPLEKLIYKREAILLTKFEKLACCKVDTVLTCSDKDTAIIKGFGANDVWTIPNGVDTTSLLPTETKFKIDDLVFLGGMGWYPNRLGIEWFVNEVLPIIVRKNPSVHLHLIGNPEPWVPLPKTVTANVTKHGFVDDFRPYVASSGIMIVPLHVGSGTRLKVVEGASLGKCMVSTRKGAEGVMLKSEEEIIFADTAEEFASAILNLQKNRTEMIRIGNNARVVAENTYDWRAIGIKLKEIYIDSDAQINKSA